MTELAKERLTEPVEFETMIWKQGTIWIIPVNKELAEQYDFNKQTVTVKLTPHPDKAPFRVAG